MEHEVKGAGGCRGGTGNVLTTSDIPTHNPVNLASLSSECFLLIADITETNTCCRAFPHAHAPPPTFHAQPLVTCFAASGSATSTTLSPPSSSPTRGPYSRLNLLRVPRGSDSRPRDWSPGGPGGKPAAAAAAADTDADSVMIRGGGSASATSEALKGPLDWGGGGGVPEGGGGIVQLQTQRRSTTPAKIYTRMLMKLLKAHWCGRQDTGCNNYAHLLEGAVHSAATSQ
jgi:hypothetical protein